MSKVVIAGDASGTGTFTISAPNGNTDRTLVLPDEAGTIITTAGVPASAMPAGSVLQVLQTVKTDTFSTTSSYPTFVGVTGLNVNITPSSTSSKILILSSFGLNNSSASGHIFANLNRGATKLFQPANASSQGLGSVALNYTANYEQSIASLTFLDSPATTSTINYSISVCVAGGGNAFVGQTGSDSNTDVNRSRLPSQITVMEIAG